MPPAPPCGGEGCAQSGEATGQGPGGLLGPVGIRQLLLQRRVDSPCLPGSVRAHVWVQVLSVPPAK